MTTESEPFYTSEIGFPSYMNCKLGEFCGKSGDYVGDGIHLENHIGSPAYMHFRTWGAQTLNITIAKEGDSEMFFSDCNEHFSTASLNGCFQLIGEFDGVNGYDLEPNYFSFDGAGSWSYLERNGFNNTLLGTGEYSVRGCTLTLCGTDGCSDHTDIEPIQDGERWFGELSIGDFFYTDTGAPDEFCN